MDLDRYLRLVEDQGFPGNARELVLELLEDLDAYDEEHSFYILHWSLRLELVGALGRTVEYICTTKNPGLQISMIRGILNYPGLESLHIDSIASAQTKAPSEVWEDYLTALRKQIDSP